MMKNPSWTVSYRRLFETSNGILIPYIIGKEPLFKDYAFWDDLLASTEALSTGWKTSVVSIHLSLIVWMFTTPWSRPFSSANGVTTWRPISSITEMKCRIMARIFTDENHKCATSSPGLCNPWCSVLPREVFYVWIQQFTRVANFSQQFELNTVVAQSLFLPIVCYLRDSRLVRSQTHTVVFFVRFADFFNLSYQDWTIDLLSFLSSLRLHLNRRL